MLGAGLDDEGLQSLHCLDPNATKAIFRYTSESHSKLSLFNPLGNPANISQSLALGY